MRVLLFGLGSIALKHLSALRELRPESEVWALRSNRTANKVDGVKNIYDWSEIPERLDFVMICNPTEAHYSTIQRCFDLKLPLFIEKPPLMDLSGATQLLQQCNAHKIRTYTAFNFRFHPTLLWLQESLKVKRVLEAQAYCGSYLPDWRPGRDYRNVYSAKKALGGGVHLDLIHELDYLLWLFGDPEVVTAFRSKVSELEIDSSDFAQYCLQYPNLNISVLLNYYRRDSKRQLEIVLEDDTWTADLLHGTVINASGKILFEDRRPVSETYIKQMEYFIDGLMLDEPYMNNLSDSIKTLKYCLG